MGDKEIVKKGNEYRSQQTGKKIVVLEITKDNVFYKIEGLETISPLFLPIYRFLHLVGAEEERN